MSKKRCVLNCPPPESEDCLLRFPVDFHLCMKWVQITGDPNLWKDFEYGGAFPFIDKYICSNHFVEIDYAVSGNKHTGLRKDAVPIGADIKAEPANGDQTHNASTPKKDEADKTKTPKNSSHDESKTQYLQKLGIFHKTPSTEEPLLIKSEPALEVDKTEPSQSESYDNNILHYLKHSPSTLALKKKSIAAFRAEEHNHESPEKRAGRLEKNRIRVANKRVNESQEQTLTRKVKCAERASIKRANETEEQRKMRLERGRIRAQERRQGMTSEERAAWRERNRIQTRERRQHEDEIKKMIRRYNNAVRASLKRSQETEEQKMERRYKDARRAAERRMNETHEEREERLRKDRERIQVKRAKLRLTVTPEEADQKEHLLSVLKTVNHHLDLQCGNVCDLKQAVKDSHPQLSSEFIDNTVEDILDGSNHSERILLEDPSLIREPEELL